MANNQAQMNKHSNGFTIVELLIGIIVLGIIVSLGIATITNQQQSRHNDERKKDILAIQASIENFYAQNGKYPSFTELNTTTWVAKNLKDLEPSSLRDPKNKSTTLSPTPRKNSYSYEVKASDDTTCDNSVKDCFKYTLTATYEGDDTFVKTNLN